MKRRIAREVNLQTPSYIESAISSLLGVFIPTPQPAGDVDPDSLTINKELRIGLHGKLIAIRDDDNKIQMTWEGIVGYHEGYQQFILSAETGFQFQSAATGARIVISGSGIEGYSNETTKEFYLDATTGKGYFAGGKAILSKDGIVLSDQLDIAYETTITSGNKSGMFTHITANPPSTSTALYQGMKSQAMSKPGNTQDLGVLTGASALSAHYGTGKVNDMYGWYASVYMPAGGGDANNIYGIRSYIWLENGCGDVIDNLFIFQGTLAYDAPGAVLNAYGIKIPTLYGTNRWGIWQDGANDKNWFAGQVEIGGFKMSTGAVADKVLTSDVDGVGTWQTATGGTPDPHVLATTGPHTDTLPWTDLNKTGSDLADLVTKAHASLTGVTADQHHNEAHIVISTGPHSGSELTIGHVLRVSAATVFSWAQLQWEDIGGKPSEFTPVAHALNGDRHTGDLAYAQLDSLVGTGASKIAAGSHASQHQNAGADEISVSGLSGKLADLQDAGWIKGKTVDDAAIGDDKILVYKTTGTKFVFEAKGAPAAHILATTGPHTGTLPWSDISGQPAYCTRWPTHAEVTSKPSYATRWPTWSEVTSKPSTFPPSSHALTAHTGDAAWSQIDSLVAVGQLRDASRLMAKSIASPVTNKYLKYNGTSLVWDEPAGGNGLWTDPGTYIYPNNWSTFKIYDDKSLELAGMTTPSVTWWGSAQANVRMDAIWNGNDNVDNTLLGVSLIVDNIPALWDPGGFVHAFSVRLWQDNYASASGDTGSLDCIFADVRAAGAQDCGCYVGRAYVYGTGGCMGFELHAQQQGSGNCYGGILWAYDQAGGQANELHGLKLDVIPGRANMGRVGLGNPCTGLYILNRGKYRAGDVIGVPHVSAAGREGGVWSGDYEWYNGINLGQIDFKDYAMVIKRGNKIGLRDWTSGTYIMGDASSDLIKLFVGSGLDFTLAATYAKFADEVQFENDANFKAYKSSTEERYQFENGVYIARSGDGIRIYIGGVPKMLLTDAGALYITGTLNENWTP